MQFLEILLSISLFLNLLLGMYFIGFVIQYRPNQVKKNEKNETGVLFYASITIGGLFGFLGNLFASSLFEFVKNSSWQWVLPIILALSGVAFFWVVIKCVQYSYELLGE